MWDLVNVFWLFPGDHLSFPMTAYISKSFKITSLKSRNLCLDFLNLGPIWSGTNRALPGPVARLQEPSLPRVLKGTREPQNTSPDRGDHQKAQAAVCLPPSTAFIPASGAPLCGFWGAVRDISPGFCGAVRDISPGSRLSFMESWRFSVITRKQVLLRQNPKKF